MKVEISEARQVIPGDAIPHECTVMRSNNNLDVACYRDRLWLAWRSAQTHFAGAESVINVISSSDMGNTWEFETTIAPGRDLREPRFLVLDGRLFLYWFEAGTNPVKFEPGQIHVICNSSGAWSEPVPISESGYVVWRARTLSNRAILSVYRGGEEIYTTRPSPTTVELWESRDGFNWAPLEGECHPVHTGGTETDFALLEDGSLLAITRKEGPYGGWGTDICRSAPDDWTRWTISSDPRKLDSPLMFVSGGRYFVIARRQVPFHGRYDLKLNLLPPLVRTRFYQLIYWLTPKRTALWEVDSERLEVSWIADLPSRGDTAFAGVVELGDGKWLVYNYSSPLDERDRIWIDGQLSPTYIYATTLMIN